MYFERNRVRQKSRNRRGRFYALLLLLFFPYGALYADTSRVDVAFFDYPPLAHMTDEGRISGEVIETVRAICEQGGLTCRFRLLPVARVYRSVNSGDASVIITGRHPSFADCCEVGQWQFPWDAGIYSRAPLSMVPENEAQLKYNRMIVIRGWRSPFRYFKNLEQMAESGHVELARAQDNISAIRMLQHNRAEYMWGGGHFRWHLRQLGLENQFNYKPLISSPLGLWVDRNRPDILIALNRGYQQLKRAGALDDSGQQLSDALMSERYRPPRSD